MMLKELLPRVLKKINIEDEQDSITDEDVKETFVIGLVRHPFDYYISLWTYNSGYYGHPGMGGFRQALSPEEKKAALGKDLKVGEIRGESSDDQKKFRNFVRIINLEDMGTLSTRFYFSYLRVMQPEVDKLEFLMKSARKIINQNTTLLKAMKKGFHNFHRYNSTRKPVSCWIRTENLFADTKICLQQYEARIGQNVVNWKRFEGMTKSKSRKANPTLHAPCSTLYDEETKAFVLLSDQYIFDAFKYPRDCSANI